MSNKKFNKNEPVLILVRRGRNGRGFTVAPIEDHTNPAICQSSAELGEAIEEILDDEKQPRVDMNELAGSSSSNSNEEEEYDEEYEDEEDDEDEEDNSPGGILDGVANAADPADQLIINALSWAANKGRNMSSKPRKPRSRARRRRPKTSK